MELDDRIEKALSELPVWAPPPHFARRLAAQADWGHRPVTRWSHRLFWAGAFLQGTAVALLAYIGSTAVSSAATSLVFTLGMMLEDYARTWSRFNL